MISIVSFQPEILTEESVSIAQLVATISASEAATFEITEGNSLNWLYIDPTTGTVSLTGAGVDAINADYPETPELEVQKLVFTITATAISDNSIASQEITAGVIRVHDEPPRIIEEIISPIYNQDAADGFRVAEIRTAYASEFTIITGADKVTVLNADTGRLTLTSAGATYVQANSGGLLEFDLFIKDTLNLKELIVPYSLNILDGSARINIPTKNILDLVGEHVGADFGTELSKVKNELFELTSQRNFSLQEDLNILNSTLTTESVLAATRLEIIEMNTRIDNKINAIRTLIDNVIVAVKRDFSTGIFTEVKELLLEFQRYNTEMQTELNTINSLTFKHEGDLKSYKDFLVRYLHHEDDRVATEAQNANDALETALNQTITTLRTAFETFRDSTYPADQGLLDQRINAAVGRLDIAEADIDTLQADLIIDEGRIATLETKATTNDNSTLIDYPVPSSWAFSQYTLQWGGATILNAATGSTTIGTYGGTGTMYVTGTYFGNATLECHGSIFTGTATKAKYADLAEQYSAGSYIEPGTIVEFTDPDSPFEIQEATGKTEAIGIISTAPGLLLNAAEEREGYWVSLALNGRVPVKVSNYKNAKRGDYLYQDLIEPSKAFASSAKFPDETLLGRVINVLEEGLVEAKV